MLDTASIAFLDSCKKSQLLWDNVSSQLKSTGWNAEQLEEAHRWYISIPEVSVIASPVLEPSSLASQTNQTRQFSPQTIRNIGADGSSLPSTTHKRSKLPLIVGAVVGILLVLATSVNALAYLISAGKVTIPNKQISLIADKLVLTNPLLPKPPKVILMKSALAHQKVLKSSLNFSLAASSDDFQSLVGGNSIDIEISGYSDVSDTANPQFSLNGSITKDFNFDIRKKDKMLYFKINKVPPILYTLVGLEANQIEPIITNWISYDTSTLNTDAQKQLQEMRTAQTPETEATQAILLKLLETDILPHLKLSHDTMDGRNAYKMEFAPTSELLDKLDQTLETQLPKLNTSSVLGVNSQQYLTAPEKKPISTYAKDVVLTWWIDEKDYYMRKMMVSMKFETPQKTTSENGAISGLPSGIAVPTKPVLMVMALRLTDFGKTLPIDTPANAVLVEEFVKQIMQTMQSAQQQKQSTDSPLGSSYAQARDAKRKSDLEVIITALSLYKADNNALPRSAEGNPFPTTATCIGAGMSCFDLVTSGDTIPLVPTYIQTIPRDPLDGTSDDTGYTIFADKNGKITASAWGEVTPTISVSK